MAKRRPYRTIHTHISEEASHILDKFTNPEGYLFKHKWEVIDTAILFLDQVFQSQMFDNQIKTMNSHTIFDKMTTEAKRKIFLEFIEQNQKIKEMEVKNDKQ